MRLRALLVAAAAALAVAPTAPAHAEDLCVVVTVSGVVNGGVGDCVPTPFPTNCFLDGGAGLTGVLWVDWLVCLP